MKMFIIIILIFNCGIVGSYQVYNGSKFSFIQVKNDIKKLHSLFSVYKKIKALSKEIFLIDLLFKAVMKFIAQLRNYTCILLENDSFFYYIKLILTTHFIHNCMFHFFFLISYMYIFLYLNYFKHVCTVLYMYVNKIS